jgi:hypothetical protein
MDETQIREKIRFIRETLGTTGWELLVRDWEEDKLALESRIRHNCKTMEEVQYARGAADVLARLTALPLVMDSVEASLDNPQDDAE